MVEARLFQALSDPTRLRILALLAQEPINVSGMVEQLGCAQPAVSRHLRVLRDVALIRDRRMGKEVEYSLNHDQLAQAAGYLEGLLTNADVGTLRTPALTQPRPGGTEEAPRKAAYEPGTGLRADAAEPEGPVAAPEVGVPADREARGRRRPAARAGRGGGRARRHATKGTRKAAAMTGPPVKAKPKRVRAGRKASSAGAKPRKVKSKREPARSETPPEREPSFVIERDADGMDDFLL